MTAPPAGRRLSSARPLRSKTRLSRTFLGLALCAVLAACKRDAPSTPAAEAPPAAPAAFAPPTPASRTPRAAHPLSDAARTQVGVTRIYDPAYVRLAYPGGDVPADRGVCTDVVIRALRREGIDLQRAIHDDRIAHPSAYPARWRDRTADSNIDHRRVPNQMAWFARQRWSIDVSDDVARADADRYRPGDIVAWDLGRGLLHIGIVSERRSARGTPLILHNIGRGTQEEDLLFAHTIIGHYRPRLATTGASRT